MISILQRFKLLFLPAAATVPEAPNSDIGSDVPIKYASQDVLRRSQFAGRVATILGQLSLDEGRVFAIRGAWGSGKSSLKNLIIERLSDHKDARCLDFNPWQWDGDAIPKALFKQIADKLDSHLSSDSSRRAATFRRYGSVLTGSGTVLRKAGEHNHIISLILANASVIALATSVGFDLPKGATIAGILAALSLGVPLIGQVLLVLGKDRWAQPLDDIKDQLETSLRTLTTPLVVFVDDIDRLEPEQIRLLIRHIKVNANLPNIVFVLLFQPSIVETALDSIANGQGRQFLKKIVQASFDLPAVSTTMVHSVMDKELNRIAGDYATPQNGFEEVRWGNAVVGTIRPFVTNLRDARRYLSSVSIHLPLHVGENVLEVNIVDFLALEALRVFEPDLHAAIFDNRELLLQSGRYRGDQHDEDNRRRLQHLVAVVDETSKPAVEEAMKLLFPRTEWAFGGPHYADGFGVAWGEEKRVCVGRYFPRYFELQIAPGEVSENEFVDLLASSGDRDTLQAALKTLEERGLLASLAGRMDEGVARLPVENAAILLPSMFDLAQKLVDRSDPFGSPWTSAWRAISWYIDRLPAVDRGETTLNAFRQTGALSVAALLVHLNDPSEHREKQDFKAKLDEPTVAALKSEWLMQISSRAVHPQHLLDDPDLVSHLYRWRDYSGSSEAPRAWVAAVVDTDGGFAQLVAQLMSTGLSHGWGDHVSSRVDSFDRNTIEEFIGIDKARSKLTETSTSDLTDRQKRAFKVLSKTLSQKSEVDGSPTEM